MATVAPTGGWSSTVPLTAGASYLYTATPGANGTVIMQWTDGTSWFTFGNSAIGTVSTGKVPAAATGIRGQGVGAAGTFEAVRDVFSPAISVMWVPIFPSDLSSPTPDMLADTSAVYELQTTKALYRSNGVSLEPYGAAGLSVDNIDSLTSADGSLEIVVPGTQAGTPRVLRKATLRPSRKIDTWADLIALPSPSEGDVHWLPAGALSTLRPAQCMYDGTRWLPLGPIDMVLYGTVAAPPTVARTAVGSYVLTAGGSSTLLAIPASLLRIGSHVEFHWVVQRTGVGTSSSNQKLVIGTNPVYGASPAALEISGDSMSGTAATELRLMGEFWVTASDAIYTTGYAGLGTNQPGCYETANATQFALGSAMGIGSYVNTYTDGTFVLQALTAKIWV